MPPPACGSNPGLEATHPEPFPQHAVEGEVILPGALCFLDVAQGREGLFECASVGLSVLQTEHGICLQLLLLLMLCKVGMWLGLLGPTSGSGSGSGSGRGGFGLPEVLTCRQHLLIVRHVPALLLALGTTHDHIVTVGRVCLHLDVVDAEVAFHPESGKWAGIRTLQPP